jgi:hypothetical protein
MSQARAFAGIAAETAVVAEIDILVEGREGPMIVPTIETGLGVPAVVTATTDTAQRRSGS